MDMDERWVNRSPETMLETFHWFRGEGFDLLVEELRARSERQPIIAEGLRLLPPLVQPLLTSPNLCSRDWIYRQYDQFVGGASVVRPGGDAAVVRIEGTRRARTMSSTSS